MAPDALGKLISEAYAKYYAANGKAAKRPGRGDSTTQSVIDLAKIGDRRRHQAKVWGLLGQFASKYTKREFMAILNEIDVPCGPIMSTSDLADDEHVLQSRQPLPQALHLATVELRRGHQHGRRAPRLPGALRDPFLDHVVDRLPFGFRKLQVVGRSARFRDEGERESKHGHERPPGRPHSTGGPRGRSAFRRLPLASSSGATWAAPLSISSTICGFARRAGRCWNPTRRSPRSRRCRGSQGRGRR